MLKNESSCETYPAVQQLLASDKKYDLVIGEFFFAQEQYTVLLHRFNAPGIAFSSVPDVTWLNDRSGLPDNSAYMGHFSADLTELDSFRGRLKNFFNTLLIKAIDYFFVVTYHQSKADEHLVYEGWQSRPSILELSADMSLMLVNSHHSLGFPVPRSPLVKEVLGTNVDETPPPLPKVHKWKDNCFPFFGRVFLNECFIMPTWPWSLVERGSWSFSSWFLAPPREPIR